MTTVGIICEYNPMHLGHVHHIERTREILGGDACVICVMSGNYVQRGDIAVFNKHARAKAAVLSGADLVIELQAPYALQSADRFAHAGVYLLESLSVCDYLSFGSESGDIDSLRTAAKAITARESERYIKVGLDRGLPYASAQQNAANNVLGESAVVFRSPNNTLGIEYIKALTDLRSSIEPLTIKRFGGDHDSLTGYSATALRKSLQSSTIPAELMPNAAEAIVTEEMKQGRGPVALEDLEQAVMSRLRAIKDFSAVPGAGDGLDRRFLRFANVSYSSASLLENVKTKRFAMSRIRRVLISAVLGITTEDVKILPPYIRLLAMNPRGIGLLRNVMKCASIPIVTKPASVKKLDEQALRIFDIESSAADFYALAYRREARAGGIDWRQTPYIAQDNKN